MPDDDGLRDHLRSLGAFIRSQREQAQLSLRELAERTNVSNPYLSQLERGLHEPSMRVLKAISSGLNIPIDALLARAGLLSDDEPGDRLGETERAILADESLTEDQRSSLLAVYRSYRSANAPTSGPG
jgi:transcriptional regulator with XRE-family HTH domain